MRCKSPTIMFITSSSSAKHRAGIDDPRGRPALMRFIGIVAGIDAECAAAALVSSPPGLRAGE